MIFFFVKLCNKKKKKTQNLTNFIKSAVQHFFFAENDKIIK